MEALYRLSWLADKTGMVPVNWRAMETEELGSVYESLLELQPQLGDDGKTLVFASEAAEQKGNQRKTTGSYYTPDSLVQALLDTALDPVLDKTETEADDPAKALLKLSVIDPACGSGHFLLAAARRIATRLARIRAEGTPSLADFRHALRDVARCCVHGVDRNPMAVELTKVALWIETVDPGLPLGFFDAQIRCGDALLGVFDLQVLQDGIPDAAYKPLTGDDKETAKYYLKANRDATAGQGGFDFGTGQASMPAMKPLALDFSGFRDLPEDTVEQIGAKAKRFKELRKGQTFVRAKAAADLYVAAFLLPKVGGAPAGASERTVPTTEELWMALNQGKMRQAMGEAPKAARNARALHWPLEFPDVMQRGGFDVVLGNPPWERIKLQEQEFFASRSPEIAKAPNKAARDRLIKALEKAAPGTTDRALFDAFTEAKREAEANSEFVRVSGEDGGRYPLTGTGDSNTYALFAEHASRLIGQRGAVGLVVPAGLMTDSKTKDLFYSLFTAGRIESFICFDNSLAIFPAIHRDTPFGLLTLQAANGLLEFCVEAKSIQDSKDPRRRFKLSSDDLDLLNCNTRTAPTFRSQADAEIAKKIYRNVPVLLMENETGMGNKWGVRLFRMFDSAQDSGLFFEKSKLVGEGFVRCGLNWGSTGTAGASTTFVPLYEGKMIGQYDHRAGTFIDCEKRPPRGASIPEPPAEAKTNTDFEIEPWYWVDSTLVKQRLDDVNWAKSWSFGYRFGANPTNIRTVICSVVPFSAAPHVFPQVIPRDDLPNETISALLANLNALVVDYICRLKMSRQGLDAFIVKQLPVLPPDFYTEPRLAFITPKVLELTYTSHSLAPFARDLGHDGPPFAWDEDRRALLRADLDAFYARAYGLTRDELRYILDPADVKGPDYPSETFRVLKEKEIRHHGEYRTRRLVLEAWDRMQQDGTFAALGMAETVDGTMQQPIQLPPLEQLPDAAWARAVPSPQYDPSAALAAILKSLDGPTPIRTIRLTAAIMLEPHLLTPILSTEDQTQWRRLVGQEAEPRPGNVVGFSGRTTPGWNAAITNHRGNGRLLEDIGARTWTPGTGLEAFDTSGWPEGRARFVLDALRNLDIDATVNAAPAEVRDWIANAAAG